MEKPETTITFEKSSNISSATYDPFMKVLTINFIHGGEYNYIEVEEEVFNEMSKASSAGRFFHARIKGKYDFLKKVKKKKEKKTTDK